MECRHCGEGIMVVTYVGRVTYRHLSGFYACHYPDGHTEAAPLIGHKDPLLREVLG